MSCIKLLLHIKTKDNEQHIFFEKHLALVLCWVSTYLSQQFPHCLVACYSCIENRVVQIISNRYDFFGIKDDSTPQPRHSVLST